SCTVHDSHPSLAVCSSTALISTAERVLHSRGSSRNVDACLSNLDTVQREARLESSSEFSGLSFLVFRQGPPDQEPVRIRPNCAHLDLLGLLVRDTINLRRGPSKRGPV